MLPIDNAAKRTIVQSISDDMSHFEANTRSFKMLVLNDC